MACHPPAIPGGQAIQCSQNRKPSRTHWPSSPKHVSLSQESYAYAARVARVIACLKLVLKSYAQERAQFCEQLRALAGELAQVASKTAAGSALGRGWASMRLVYHSATEQAAPAHAEGSPK